MLEAAPSIACRMTEGAHRVLQPRGGARVAQRQHHRAHGLLQRPQDGLSGHAGPQAEQGRCAQALRLLRACTRRTAFMYDPGCERARAQRACLCTTA